MTEPTTSTTCSSCQSWTAERKPSQDIGVQYAQFRRCNFIQQFQFSGRATFFQDRTWTHPDATCADHRPRRQL